MRALPENSYVRFDSGTPAVPRWIFLLLPGILLLHHTFPPMDRRASLSVPSI